MAVLDSKKTPKYKIRLNKHLLSSATRSTVTKTLQAPLCGNGPFGQRCQTWLEQQTGAVKILLTSSCTDALEMAGLLANLNPGDEVILPSYTFSSTANAIALRGAIPVFVDIRPDTLNIDENLLTAAITKRTKAICVVHYAGVSCAMKKIMAVAKRHKLIVIEDAAQAVGAYYYSQPLGTFGDFGAFSFHDSKVVTSGEGGALLLKHKADVRRAETLWEKGTNRAKLIRGEISKYTWVDIGSSFLMGELAATLLWTQLAYSSRLIKTRLELWNKYHRLLAPLEKDGLLRRPIVPDGCEHNGHIYYILLKNQKQREALRTHLCKENIEACFHYIPLHSSPAGKSFGRATTSMKVTDHVAATLLRLPIYVGLSQNQQKHIVNSIYRFWNRRA